MDHAFWLGSVIFDGGARHPGVRPTSTAIPRAPSRRPRRC
jgi:hypothetical protein